jgi:mRNA-degrading endonuclease RelE of RelBE toxin-antitoxin system
MNLIPTAGYRRDFSRLPHRVQQRVIKALELLSTNPRHPSLHFKRIKGRENLWEVRVTKSYRIVLEQGSGEDFYLRTVGTHDVLKKP